MKVRVTYTYKVDINEDVYDELAEDTVRMYQDEHLEPDTDVVGPWIRAMADHAVIMSQVGDWTEIVTLTNIEYEEE